MSSAVKTLQLLSYFSADRPEIGLSELCRDAKRDKATTHRHLQDLEKVGFVEQNIETKCYRLGPALLQLAQAREATVPRKKGVKDALRRLAKTTGETAHASLLSGTTLHLLDHCESTAHSIRVIIDVATFPLHATASGFCMLAFGQADLMAAACQDMEAFTSHTPKNRADLENAVQHVRETGFGCANKTFEEDVYSISVPLFDETGHVAGALSLASVATRHTENTDLTIKRELVLASREISRNWGGAVPASVEALWAHFFQSHKISEATA